ncbi:MAG: flagellin [Gemmatimonadaceae bacterium]
MFIQNNINSMNALNNLNTNETQLTSSIQKLSSGFRLNRAGDDAAGMSIANSLRNNGVGLKQAQQNASQAGSLLQIADGATSTISAILDRMKQLATESASANVTDPDRQKINAEFTQLYQEINRTVASTSYQGSQLLDGSFGVTVAPGAGGGTATQIAGFTDLSVAGATAGATYTLTKVDASHMTLSDGTVTQSVVTALTGTQSFNFDKLGISFTFTGDAATALTTTTILPTGNSAAFRVGSGATDDTQNLVNVSLGDLRASNGLGLSTTSLDTMANATAALVTISAAVGKVNTVIGTLGAAENRLNYASTNVASLYQNVSAAESVIRDTNMAQEYTNFSKLSILQQAGTAMLAQANSSQQSVLKLFQ